MSKDTTLGEVTQFDGITESEQRRLSVNMTNVPANALDLGVKLMGLPTLSEWEKEFEKDMAA